MNSKNNNSSMNVYTLEQIADIVWLSKYIPFNKRDEHKDKDESKDFDDDIDDIDGEFDNIEDEEYNELSSTTEVDASLYSKEGKNREKSSIIKADPIRTPRKLSLSNHREWERSFRRLRYKIDSNSRFVLDESKTVDSIAQTKIYQAILKGKRENYFNLTLIIDQSSSMEIWRELTDEFKRTIQRFGLFNSITFYYLDTKSPEAKLFSDKNKQTKISYKQLALSDKRGLILILSDCVSPAWRSNHLFKLIEFWSQYAFTSIVQMFPKRMWRGTALDIGFQTSFSSNRFNQLNKNLRSKDEDEGLNIPVIAFEPISFRHWADVVFGREDRWIDGIQLEEFEVVKRVPISKTKKLTAEQREQNYRIHASPLAKELAVYASFFPINFQIIRMLQELKLPNSNQSHLAEFFLGGLVKKEEIAEKVYYEFHDGVKEILQKKIGSREAFRTFMMMSDFVAKNINSSLDFQALIFNPNSIGGLSLSESDIAFAKICVDVLKRRGGEYEGIAENIEREISEKKSIQLELNRNSDYNRESEEKKRPKREYTSNIVALPIGYNIENHYEIINILGQGGFSIVYLVKDKYSDRVFVAKELFILGYSIRSRDKLTVLTNKNTAKEIFEKVKEDIKQEINILAKFVHKNIVKAYGYIEENQTIYSIMEYIEGENLDNAIKDISFSEEEAIELLLQIIYGLKEIHDKNIIHRDIKPSNVMVTKKNDTILYKLIDFTTSKTYSVNKTYITGIRNRGYTPPELQQTKAVIGAFSDIYSLGMTIYYCFHSDDSKIPSVADRYMNDSFSEQIDSLNISYRFKSLIKKMTQLNPQDRFQSLEELEKELILIEHNISIGDFPKEILFLDKINIGDCILEDNKTTIDVVVKQIWEGNRTIIDELKKIGGWFDKNSDNNPCDGIKDILIDWEKQGIETFIFYIPRRTIKEITKKFFKRAKNKIILEKIESYIFTQCEINMPRLSVYSLNNESSEVNNIFDVLALKEGFDQDSKESEKIYFMGLKYSLNANNEIGCYLNNIPIGEESGLILGNSNILRHKLKKGYMSIEVDDGIEIEFFDTHKFSSKDEEVGDDLKDIDFKQDSLTIELDNYNSPIILESIKEKDLIFSIDESSEYIDDTNQFTQLADRTTKINMDSFFIPKNKGLKSLNLLLVYKDGQKILAGGQYHSDLKDCNVLAELSVNFEQESISVINHSNTKLSFINYDNDFWKLLDVHENYITDSSGAYIDIDMGDDILRQSINPNLEPLIIEKDEKHIFKINEIEFNDSNVYFDKDGVLIRYSSFCIAEFEKEFALHRTAYRMSDNGTIIDCFVNQPSKGVFEYGARVYDDYSTILGTIISSQPIRLRQLKEGLEIDATALVARGYTVQIISSSKTYMLKDRYNAKKTIKKSEMKNLEIEVIHKSLKKPLIEFSLEFD